MNSCWECSAQEIPMLSATVGVATTRAPCQRTCSLLREAIQGVWPLRSSNDVGRGHGRYLDKLHVVGVLLHNYILCLPLGALSDTPLHAANVLRFVPNGGDPHSLR